MIAARLARLTLIAAHAALAVQAVAALHIQVPPSPLLQWQVAGQPGPVMAQAPRRLPESRRAGRVQGTATHD